MPRPTASFLSAAPAPRLRLRRLAASVAVAPAALLAFATLALTPSTAAAASYTIWQCHDRSGASVESTPGLVKGVNAWTADHCGVGGAIEVSVAGDTLSPWGSEWQSAGFEFRVPDTLPNTRISNVSFETGIAAKTGDAALSYGHYGVYSEAGTHYEVSVPAGSWAGFRTMFLGTSDATGASIAGGSKWAQFRMQCYGPCDFGGAPMMTMGRASITFDDPVAPNPAMPEYTGLLDGTDQKGARRLRYAASDADSGVQRIELRSATGVMLGTTTPGRDCAFTRPVPCQQSRAYEEFSIDTTRLPEGRQQLELWTYDAAGNVRKTGLPPFTVRNVAPTPAPTPTPTPVSTPTPSLPRSTPAPTPAPTPTPKKTPGVATPSGDDPTPTPTPSTTLVRSTVSFALSNRSIRAGGRITFSGLVTPAPEASGRVTIEAKSGKRWITAAVVRTDSQGSYTWTHRFRKPGAFTMRARLLTSADSRQRAAISAATTFRVR